MLDEPELRAALTSGGLTVALADEVMATITSLVNHKETHDRGREYVIRALAARESLPRYHDELLDALLRSTGLLPYAGEPTTIEDEILRQAHAVPELKDGTVFHSLQLQVFNLIMKGANVVLSATTSVGKSMIIDAVIASSKFRKLLVIVPTIALIDETRRRLSAKFGETHAIITHPSQRSNAAERTVFVLTQERVLARDDLGDVEFFVLDEFYKLDLQGEDERAVDLNLAFHRLTSAGAQFYLIGPHVEEVRGINSRFDFVFIPSKFSTVALNVTIFGLPKEGDARPRKLVELARELETPTLVYCQSPAKAAEAAQALLNSGDFHSRQETSDAVDWLEQEFPEEWVVTKALRHGIGIHHGNVPRAIQQYMIRCFERRIIRFLICTSTIIEGVNTIAENVIIYDRRLKTGNIDYFTFRNIAGRAGRMRHWFVGKVFVLETPPEPQHVAVDLPIERQDHKTAMSLIFDLPDEDLTELSRSRVEAASQEASLSLSTLKANRHIPIEAQRNIAAAVKQNSIYSEILNWRGMPDSDQLVAACELIYDYIDHDGASLKGYQVFNGRQLAAVLTKLATSPSIRAFIDDRVTNRRPGQSVSDAVELTLRFLRKFVTYNFPRQLTAIQVIHVDVLARSGRRSTADYSFYAALTENLFIDSGLYALDDYGIPPQTARRIGARFKDIDTLDKALAVIARLDLNSGNFHPFEKELLAELLVKPHGRFAD
ncbi:MAG: DEAD/DEAH box helicase [Methylobacterium sp.]|uniref:DEAD/DEAH box helicase n=1 Tax=Methylobacterium sp. TaxID=409 RepID=UPI00271BF6A3|nr:DEAD/DEAH box helicase [Methylobacterium sp.]MDO9427852.1 DEAD/DEAH box helicase [Methylobacterium sp.]